MARRILFEIGDGPDGVTFFVDPDKAVVDWAAGLDALYVDVSTNGSFGRFGPMLPGVTRQLREKLSIPSPAVDFESLTE